MMTGSAEPEGCEMTSLPSPWMTRERLPRQYTLAERMSPSPRATVWSEEVRAVRLYGAEFAMMMTHGKLSTGGISPRADANVALASLADRPLLASLPLTLSTYSVIG